MVFLCITLITAPVTLQRTVRMHRILTSGLSLRVSLSELIIEIDVSNSGLSNYILWFDFTLKISCHPIHYIYTNSFRYQSWNHYSCLISLKKKKKKASAKTRTSRLWVGTTSHHKCIPWIGFNWSTVFSVHTLGHFPPDSISKEEPPLFSSASQVWAALHHCGHHHFIRTLLNRRKPATGIKEGEKLKTDEEWTHNRPVMTVQASAAATVILLPLLQRRPHLPRLPPCSVCPCKHPWPGGLGWGGSPESASPEEL